MIRVAIGDKHIRYGFKDFDFYHIQYFSHFIGKKISCISHWNSINFHFHRKSGWSLLTHADKKSNNFSVIKIYWNSSIDNQRNVLVVEISFSTWMSCPFFWQSMDHLWKILLKTSNKIIRHNFNEFSSGLTLAVDRKLTNFNITIFKNFHLMLELLAALNETLSILSCLSTQVNISI